MSYGSTPTITAGYSGFVNGDTAASLTTPPTCSTTATSSSPVSPPTYPSSCSGAVDPNYTISYVPGAVTVTKAPLTITASNGSMTYGGTVPTITPVYSGFENGDGAAIADDTADVLDDGHELEPGFAADLSVLVQRGRRPQLRHQLRRGHGDGEQGPADDHRVERLHELRRDGADDHAGYSGFVNGDTSSSLTTPPTCTTTATSSSPASPPSYPSSCSGAVDPNYAISYVAGSVTVSPVPLTITASSPAIAYGSVAHHHPHLLRASSTATPRHR